MNQYQFDGTDQPQKSYKQRFYEVFQLLKRQSKSTIFGLFLLATLLPTLVFLMQLRSIVYKVKDDSQNSGTMIAFVEKSCLLVTTGCLLLVVLFILTALNKHKIFIRYGVPILNQMAIMTLVPIQLFHSPLFGLAVINLISLVLMTELNCIVMCNFKFQYGVNLAIFTFYGFCSNFVKTEFEAESIMQDAKTVDWLPGKILDPHG